MATENMYRRVVNAIKNQTPPLGELTSSKASQWRGWGEDTYNPDDLIGRKGLGIYREIRKDEQAKAALLIKKFAVLAGGWDIEPGSEARKDKKAADYTKYALNRMESSFANNLLEMLTCMDFGFSTTEKNFMQYTDGPYSGLWGLKSLKTREPDDFIFVTDEYDNLKGLKQGYNEKILPADKFIIYTYNSEFGNWYGRSDLREAYRSWWSKNNIIKWWNMLLERFGIPPTIGKYGSPGQQSALQDVLEKLLSKTTITVPKEVEIELIEAAMRGADVFELAIRYHDGSIAKAIFLPSLSGFAEQSGVGSYAQASKQFDAFMWVVGQIQKHLSEAIIGEQLIRYLVDLNMEVNEYPKLVFPPLSDEQLDYIFNLFFTAIEKGAVKSTPEDEKHIREALHFPERKIIEDEEKPPVIDEPETPPELPATPQPEEPGKPEGEETKTTFAKTGLNRQPNKYEKKVNFAQLQKDMDSDEARIRKEMVAILDRTRKGLVNWLEPRLWQMKVKEVKNIELKNKRELVDVFKKFTTETYIGGKDKGRAEIKKELAAIKSPGPLPATQAINFFAEKANFYVTGITGKLEAEVHGILYNGLKTGEGVKTITEKINTAFQPYLGDHTAIVDAKVVDPFRLETVIRTNYTEAYNWGRKDMFADPDVKDYIIGIEYSGILDARTTDVCGFLDGKIFRPDSSAVDQLTPPNHYNCRSVLVPVTKDEGPVEFITEAEINRALTLKQRGF